MDALNGFRRSHLDLRRSGRACMHQSYPYIPTERIVLIKALLGGGILDLYVRIPHVEVCTLLPVQALSSDSRPPHAILVADAGFKDVGTLLRLRSCFLRPTKLAILVHKTSFRTNPCSAFPNAVILKSTDTLLITCIQQYYRREHPSHSDCNAGDGN